MYKQFTVLYVYQFDIFKIFLNYNLIFGLSPTNDRESVDRLNILFLFHYYNNVLKGWNSKKKISVSFDRPIDTDAFTRDTRGRQEISLR